MKRTLHSLAALVLALCLLCLPMSALAESYSAVALTLSNPSLTVDGESYPLDLSLNLDVGYDAEKAAGRVLASLMGGNEIALSGGINWTSTELVAALDGMSQGIFLPLDALLNAFISAMDDELYEAGLNDLINSELKNALQAFIDYVNTGDWPIMPA